MLMTKKSSWLAAHWLSWPHGGVASILKIVEFALVIHSMTSSNNTTLVTNDNNNKQWCNNCNNDKDNAKTTMVMTKQHRMCYLLFFCILLHILLFVFFWLNGFCIGGGETQPPFLSFFCFVSLFFFQILWCFSRFPLFSQQFFLFLLAKIKFFLLWKNSTFLARGFPWDQIFCRIFVFLVAYLHFLANNLHNFWKQCMFPIKVRNMVAQWKKNCIKNYPEKVKFFWALSTWKEHIPGVGTAEGTFNLCILFFVLFFVFICVNSVFFCVCFWVAFFEGRCWTPPPRLLCGPFWLCVMLEN